MLKCLSMSKKPMLKLRRLKSMKSLLSAKCLSVQENSSNPVKVHEALIHSCEWRTIHSSTCTMQGLRMLCSLAFGCSAGVLVYAELFLGANDTQQTSALVVRLGVGKILCSFVLRFTHSENIHLCSIAQNLESSLAQNRCSRHNS